MQFPKWVHPFDFWGYWLPLDSLCSLIYHVHDVYYNYMPDLVHIWSKDAHQPPALLIDKGQNAVRILPRTAGHDVRFLVGF
ncbi:MAG TPA: hypothetical protein DCF63_04135 [Planctomycetaceae bacterium]|nr:hypothetical protein [Planctomycetaceae bacterium]